jgi:hypothetical protein
MSKHFRSERIAESRPNGNDTLYHTTSAAKSGGRDSSKIMEKWWDNQRELKEKAAKEKSKWRGY